MDVVVKNCTMVSKIESLRESAKHSGSILASNPAALGSHSREFILMLLRFINNFGYLTIVVDIITQVFCGIIFLGPLRHELGYYKSLCHCLRKYFSNNYVLIKHV